MSDHPTGHTTPQQVLITGANGFIGKTLMSHYKSLGISVVGVDLVGNGADIIQGDISQPEGISALLEASDVVVHTAALVSNAMQDSDMWRVNVLATRNLAHAAREHGVRRFVQISSVVAFGNDAVGELDEDYPVHAAGGSYVLTKLASEHVVLAAGMNSDMEVVIIRPGDIYGPGSRPWVIAPLEAIAGNQFLLPASGEGFFRPLYVDDLVRGIALASSADTAANEIITLSCEGYVSTREFFSHHYQWLGKKGPLCVPTWLGMTVATVMDRIARLRRIPNEASPATISQLNTRCWFAIGKAERLLAWKPTISLDEGMKRSREWAADQGLL
jgi:nucleoside-diphosphate-sugar epimerase